MQRRSWCFVLSVASALFIPPSAFGAGGIVVPGNKGGNNMKEEKELTLRFVASKEAMIGGKKQVVSLLTYLNGSGAIQVVPKPDDKDAAIEATIEKLQKGDVIKVKLGQAYGMRTIDYIKKVDVVPAEENPHGFVFEEFYNEPNTGAPIVRLVKFGDSYEFTFPMVKDDKGKMQPDQAMVDSVQKFKAHQPVYVTFYPAGAGRPYVATMIFPYSDPQTGKLTKVSEQEVEGGKTPAVEIESADGKAVTALVPGRVNNKRFTPDPTLAREARMFKPGTEVTYLTRDDNWKTYLVEIARAPKTATSGAGKTGSDISTAKAK